MRIGVIGAAVALATATSGVAADRTATRAIAAGDYIEAERTLAAERRIFPRRPELMLNLAAVYRETGRDAEAQALYADVLRREAVMMDTLSRRTESSHAIARAGLSRVTQQMAAR